MVSDQEIASCVETLLRQQSSDPANAGAAISLAGVVHQVSANLGLDLSHKSDFIRDQIHLLLGPPQPLQPPPQPQPHFIFQPQQQQQQQFGFLVPQQQFGYGGMGMGMGMGMGVVGVAPPQQYGHGPVPLGAKPIGSAVGKER